MVISAVCVQRTHSSVGEEMRGRSVLTCMCKKGDGGGAYSDDSTILRSPLGAEEGEEEDVVEVMPHVQRYRSLPHRE